MSRQPNMRCSESLVQKALTRRRFVGSCYLACVALAERPRANSLAYAGYQTKSAALVMCCDGLVGQRAEPTNDIMQAAADKRARAYAAAQCAKGELRSREWLVGKRFY